MIKSRFLFRTSLQWTLSTCLIWGAVSILAPAWAQPSPVRVEDAEIQLYQRKHIALYFQQPELSLNQLFAQRFSELMPRFRCFQLQHHNSSDFGLFLQKLRRFHQEQAGALAAEGTAPSLEYDSRIVTWSDTQAVARAAFAFHNRFDFSPIELNGLERETIAPDDQGRSRPHKIPSGAYYQSRDVDVEVKDEETGESKEVTAEAYDYWYVKSGSELTHQVQIYDLKDTPATYHDDYSHQWDFSSATLVLKSDVDPLGYVDLDDSDDQEKVLARPRFQALTRQDPYEVYGDEAQSRLSFDPLWPSLFVQELKQQDAFKLKTQVEKTDTHHIWSHFGDAENAESLGLRRRDWYELREYREQGDQFESRHLGYTRVRGFLDGQALMSDFDLQRPAELGDQLLEYPGHQIQWAWGAGPQFFDSVWGLNLMTRVAWPIDRHDAAWFNDRLAEGSPAERARHAQALAHNWEHDGFIELNAGLLGPFSRLELQAGWWARHYWGQTYLSLGLAPGLGVGLSESEEWRIGLHGLLGAGYQFNPAWSFNAEAQLSGYWPTAWGGQLRFFGSYAF